MKEFCPKCDSPLYGLPYCQQCDSEVEENDQEYFDDIDEDEDEEYEALSREVLLKRGYCCGCGCKNCPY
jgi:hypothetical protein